MIDSRVRSNARGGTWETPDGAAERLLDALDPEQRAVATTLSGPVAVIAGAGTGKTRAITHRIAYGARVGVYNPATVLAVTFTTRAAGELRGRLQHLGVYGVQARTFHSAALRQAQYFWPQVYGGDLPAVADNKMSLVAEASSRLRVPVDTAKLRDLVGEISWAKVSNVSAEDYPAVSRGFNRNLASVEPETVGRIFTAYEEAKQAKNKIDFDDILLCTTALLSDHPEIADQVRRTYRHLVVDEYQDVSPLQESLLRLWLGRSRDLCVVGDPAQTIHSFAGAQSHFLTGFARRHPDTTVIRLVRDYRSTPQVVEVANTIMKRAGRDGSGSGSAMAAVTLVAQRPTGAKPEFVEAPDEASEAAAVADWLRERARAGVEYREMAVLFRINAQSPAIEQALSDRGIPYLVRGAERFYERPEVRQALGVLRTHKQVRDDLPVADQVREVLEGLGWTTTAPSGAGAARERWESLAALVSVADDMVAADAYTTYEAVIDELERRAAAQHAPQAQGVTVSTIHSAKGLEWDAVAVIGAHEGTLPFVLAQKPHEIAEERRLLYVAVTRAREHLRISWSRSRNGGSGHRNPSRFLDTLCEATSQVRPAARTVRKERGTRLNVQCRVCGRPLEGAGARKLGRHEECPSTYDEHTMEVLREWRKQEASEQKLPAYCVFTDATLVAIAEARPRTDLELLRLPGIGKTKAERYGAAVAAIVEQTDPAESSK